MFSSDCEARGKVPRRSSGRRLARERERESNVPAAASDRWASVKAAAAVRLTGLQIACEIGIGIGDQIRGSNVSGQAPISNECSSTFCRQYSSASPDGVGQDTMYLIARHKFAPSNRSAQKVPVQRCKKKPVTVATGICGVIVSEGWAVRRLAGRFYASHSNVYPTANCERAAPLQQYVGAHI